MCPLHELINLRHPEHYLGDVHPFYDTITRRWMMYYLLPGGQYQSGLMVSTDLLHWTSVPLIFEGTPRANYFVVAVLRTQGQLVSWFGQQFTHVCSVSDDGIHWRANPAWDIPVNRMASPLGERDPFVTFDKDRQCFYEVALAYINNPLDCAITFKKTSAAQLDTWEWISLPLIRFHNTPSWEVGEPECPQLIKIRHRWYLFASLAHRTVHHVGGLSYWIGDIDTDPEKVVWEEKPMQRLTGEDLCAAQLVFHNNQYRVYGWIPQNYRGNEWGGHLNAALLVHATPDGTLTTSPDTSFWDHFQETLLYDVHHTKEVDFFLRGDSAYSIHATLDLTQKASIVFEHAHALPIQILLDPLENILRASNGSGIVLSQIPLWPSHPIQKTELWMLINRDIMEIHVGNQTTLHVRLSRSITNDHLSFFCETLDQCSISTLQLKEKE